MYVLYILCGAAMSNKPKADLTDRVRKFLDWVRTTVPPGARFGMGVLLIIGGVLGFLPVLDFWMIPLGVAVALLDVNQLRNWWRKRAGRQDKSE